MKSKLQTSYISLIFIFFILSFSGCGILVGNVKPMTEKTNRYQIEPLERAPHSQWKKISSSELTSNSDEPEMNTPDVTYQSKINSTIISLNSSCKTSDGKASESLEKITDLLILGVSNIKNKKQTFSKVDTQAALETSLTGVLNNQEVSIKTVITRKGACIFDFMYIAQPNHFEKDMETFSQFVASFKSN